MKTGNASLSSYGTTIFEAMSALAREHAAVNLGQGFPDDQGRLDLRKAAADYVIDGHNQYPPMMGMPELRQAVAAHNRRFYGLEVDWQTEVLITSGATEALLDCFLGLLEAGDEVVLLEPAYDTYAPVIHRLGAVPRSVRLVPPTWSLPRDELAAAFSSKTKLLVLNSPMNPAGKVFTHEELSFLAALAEQHDAFVVCDEVYEHLVFGNVRHIPLMTLPGMRQRALRIGSAGKTFSVTGWKVGYITAPAALLRPITKAHQFVTFTTPPNLQHAVALGLGFEEAYFRGLGAPLARGRDRLASGVAALEMPVLPGDGTYFLVLDVTRWLRPEEDDVAFCRRLVVEAGVVLIPMSAFYEAAPPRHLVRACFCKQDATLDAALQRLERWVGKQR
ncbi:MAG TPA: aminotransferase [Kofleriaceae bacterium]|nr:aminotransferase [Kofleriaceae bacterium]